MRHDTDDPTFVMAFVFATVIFLAITAVVVAALARLFVWIWP